MNQNTPLVSIIIPVYKAEKYFQRCLDSIERQTYTNLEVLLVDDGSPDKCGIICDKYAGEHSNTKVIHQSNQGQSAARNNGVKAARGNLITFVDADDYITDDYVSYLVNLVNKYRVSMAIANSFEQWESVGVSVKKEWTACWNTEETLKKLCYYRDGFGVSAWGKIYNRDLLLSNPYPIGRTMEELFVTYNVISSCEKIAYGNKKIYYYCDTPGSVTKCTINHEQWMYAIESTKKIITDMQSKFPRVASASVNLFARYITGYSLYMARSNELDKEKFIWLKKELRPYLIDIMKDPYINIRIKMRCMAIEMGVVMTKMLMYCSDAIKNIPYIHKIVKNP